MEIEKNIPLLNHPNRKYDFGAMEIGDSYLLSPKKLRHAVFSSLRWYNSKNKTSIRIMTRTVGESVRVWRTA